MKLKPTARRSTNVEDRRNKLPSGYRRTVEGKVETNPAAFRLKRLKYHEETGRAGPFPLTERLKKGSSK